MTKLQFAALFCPCLGNWKLQDLLQVEPGRWSPYIPWMWKLILGTEGQLANLWDQNALFKTRIQDLSYLVFYQNKLLYSYILLIEARMHFLRPDCIFFLRRGYIFHGKIKLGWRIISVLVNIYLNERWRTWPKIKK